MECCLSDSWPLYFAGITCFYVSVWKKKPFKKPKYFLLDTTNQHFISTILLEMILAFWSGTKWPVLIEMSHRITLCYQYAIKANGTFSQMIDLSLTAYKTVRGAMEMNLVGYILRSKSHSKQARSLENMTCFIYNADKK